MNKFIVENIFKPFAKQWIRGGIILLAWTITFIALPAISGWFLAACSIAFITANTLFSYLVPSAIIRFIAIIRTVTRYFEKLENHRTTLKVQQRLQLKIFQSVAKLPYFQKQGNNNASLLENSTHGMDLILNHILLWVLPFFSILVAIGLSVVILAGFEQLIAVEFLISSAIILFIVPQLFSLANKMLFEKLKHAREENQQTLIENFRGRIELTKYHLEERAIAQYEKKLSYIEEIEKKLQINSFSLQLLAGLIFSILAIFILWHSSNYAINAQTAIGIFFGIITQAELSEMLFSGKAEKNSVARHINDVDNLIRNENEKKEAPGISSELEDIVLQNWSATIPQTNIITSPIAIKIKKRNWIAIFGATGKGKSTLLNSLFFPEYQKRGHLIWNGEQISNFVPPRCIYVTQKAYLLTGTLKENFQGYDDAAINEALEIVDLKKWAQLLPKGLDTWLGENGETLSGGQRKKLLLAQALLKKPELLVIDEPTAGISTENAIEVFNTIKTNYPDITILIATHLKAFEKVVDQSFFM